MTAIPTQQRAYSGSHLVRLVVTAGIVPVLCATVAAGLMVSWADELPNPIAIHWGANGQVDGYGSLASMVILVLALVGVFAGAVTASLARMHAVAASPSRHQPRFLGATSVWLGVCLSVGVAGSANVQRGVADAADVGSIVAPMATGAIAGLVLAAVAWFVIPAPAVAPNELDDGAEPMNLAAEERVSWSTSIRPSTALVAIFVGILIVSITASGFGAAAGGSGVLWFAVGLLALVLVASVVSFFWRVTITSSGFSVRTAGGALGITIPLRDIAAARVIRVSPLSDFGGWGWRFASGRTGIVIRAGEALEVERASGKSVVVTVDDAATAAALLEGLVERRRTA